MGESDARAVDFAQVRVNQIADAIRMLAEQIKFTDTHVERLHREVGELPTEVSGLRTEVTSRFIAMNARLDDQNRAFREPGSEVILQANQIIDA